MRNVVLQMAAALFVLLSAVAMAMAEQAPSAASMAVWQLSSSSSSSGCSTTSFAP
jgi:hypothetical protein